MVEANLKILIKGITDENTSNTLGEAVAGAIGAFAEAGGGFDLRRMHRLIVTTDFSGEIAEISQQNSSMNAITYTKEEYGEAGAIVLLLPLEEDFEIVPVINAATVAGFLLEPMSMDSHPFRYATHLLHHELAHVHDNNQKIDAFRNVLKQVRYTGKDMHLRPIAEACWSEFFANLASYSSANAQIVSEASETFTDALKRTKPLIEAEIQRYRETHDLTHIFSILKRHGDFLLKSAAYVLGYLEGGGKSSPELANLAEGSYFEDTFKGMHKALKGMLQVYPEWERLEVYDELAQVIEQYYDLLGFQLSNTEDGGVYVSIPLRPAPIQ